jgi:poly(A) polymerase
MQKHALSILRTLREHGFTALLAGGCVRDMLMGRTPGDYDIVTDASPQQVRRLFRRTVPVGVQFGIVIVLMGDAKYEVAQFRNVNAADDPLHEDARHRDFTINGMFYDPFTEQVFDYVGGQHDMKRRLIRAIEDPRARFAEDKLRMMRAVRFALTCDYQIEAATFAAIRPLASQILCVSAERIRDELLKILTAPHADRGLRLLDESGVLAHILPEVTAMQGVQQPPQWHPEGDVFEHTLLMLQQMSAPSPELALAVLLHDVGKPATFTHTDRIRFPNHGEVGAEMAGQICRRLKCSSRTTEKVVSLVRQHLKFFDVPHMRKSTLKRFLRQEHIADLLELYRLDCLSSSRDLDAYHFCRAKLEEFQQETIRPPRLISGSDLIRLGFTPGPVLGQVLECVEDAQLEGTVATRREALDFAAELRETLGAHETPPHDQSCGQANKA